MSSGSVKGLITCSGLLKRRQQVDKTNARHAQTLNRSDSQHGDESIPFVYFVMSDRVHDNRVTAVMADRCVMAIGAEERLSSEAVDEQPLQPPHIQGFPVFPAADQK